MIANSTAVKSPRELDTTTTQPMSDPGPLELHDEETKPPIPLAMTMERTLDNATEKKTKFSIHVRPDDRSINSLELGVEATNGNYGKKIAAALRTITEVDEPQEPSSNINSNYYNRLVGWSSGPPRKNEKSNVTVLPPAAHGRGQGTVLAGKHDSNSSVPPNNQGARETVPPLAARDPDEAQAVIVLDASVQDMSNVLEAILVDDVNDDTGISQDPKLPRSEQSWMKRRVALVCSIVLMVSIGVVCWIELKPSGGSGVELKSGDGSGDERKSEGGTDVFYCGCTLCTDSVLDKDADGFTVRSRIEWLTSNRGVSEEEACSTVCGHEFWTTCIQCDPSDCQGNNGDGGQQE
ncbi:hypothetical protein ACHAW6_006588 [Cyclotella cf. meneghiniana]